MVYSRTDSNHLRVTRVRLFCAATVYVDNGGNGYVDKIIEISFFGGKRQLSRINDMPSNPEVFTEADKIYRQQIERFKIDAPYRIGI